MAELNFGLLTPPGSQNIGNAFVQGMDQAAVARAQENQNALSQYALSKARREDELTNQMLAGMQGADTIEKQADVLRRGGRYKEANELINAGLDRQIKQGTLAAQPGTAARVAVQTARDRQTFEGQAIRDLRINPSDDNIRALGQDAVIKGIYTQDQADQKVAEFLAIPLDQRVARFSQYGAPAVVPRQPNLAADLLIPGPDGTLVPNTALVGVKTRLARESRPPRPEAAPRTQQVTMSDGTLGIMNMDTGAITPSTLGGAPVKGKPSAFAEKTAAQQKQLGKDLEFAITQLTAVTKDGGLIDQSTGSGVGQLIDAAAAFGGKAMPGAIAAGKLKPIADLALKLIPRFEGPQSNADTKSYKEASGQLADTSLPNQIRKEAGRVVLGLVQARKNQFVTSDMVTEGAPAAGGVVDFGSLK
jgi:hypothetical protein